jgi:hypothetical protein
VGTRVVGRVQGDTFHKSIAPNHYLTTPPAIAFDISTLEDAEQAGAVWVEVKDRVTKTKYKAKISHIWEKGFGLNRNWGEQIALPMDGWIKSGQPIQERLF